MYSIPLEYGRCLLDFFVRYLDMSQSSPYPGGLWDEGHRTCLQPLQHQNAVESSDSEFTVYICYFTSAHMFSHLSHSQCHDTCDIPM